MILIVKVKVIDRTLMIAEEIEIIKGKMMAKRRLKIKRVEETIVHQMKSVNQKETKERIKHPRTKNVCLNLVIRQECLISTKNL